MIDDLQQTLGDWSGHANQQYVGKIDKVTVSPTQTWTPEYYIDHFLHSNQRPITDWNRNVICAALGKYNGAPPFNRFDLDRHLNEMWKLASVP